MRGVLTIIILLECLFIYNSEASEISYFDAAGRTAYYQNSTSVAQKFLIPPLATLDSLELGVIGPASAEYSVSVYLDYYDSGVPTLESPLSVFKLVKQTDGREISHISLSNMIAKGIILYVVVTSEDGVMLRSDQIDKLPYCEGRRGELFRTQFIMRSDEWEAGLYDFDMKLWFTPDKTDENALPFELRSLSEQAASGLSLMVDDVDMDGDLDLYHGGLLFRSDGKGGYLKEALPEDTIALFSLHEDYSADVALYSIRKGTKDKYLITLNPNSLETSQDTIILPPEIGEPISMSLSKQASDNHLLEMIYLKNNGTLGGAEIDLDAQTAVIIDRKEAISRVFDYPYQLSSAETNTIVSKPSSQDPTSYAQGVFQDIQYTSGLKTGIAGKSSTGFLKPESLGYSIGDINGDSLNDIVLFSDCPCKSLSIFKNTGSGFQNVTHEWGLPYLNIGPDGLLVDLDQDGDLDIFSASEGIPIIIENHFGKDNTSDIRNSSIGGRSDYSSVRYNHRSGGILKQGPTLAITENNLLNEKKKSDFSATVFPNPSSGLFTIEINSVTNLEELEMVLYTQDMRKLADLSQQTVIQGISKFDIDLSQYGKIGNGTYFIVLNSKGTNAILTTVVSK